MKTTLLAGLAVAALLAAGGAAAQQAAAHVRGDADGDGRISEAEFVGARVQRLATADADRDGSVTREEARAVIQARRAERVAHRFDRLDADGDGALSRAEFEAPRQARGEPGARVLRTARMHARRLGKAGRGPIVIADVQARAARAFARLDADHDGFVTREERRAGLRQARGGRGRHHAHRQASPPTPASE